MKVVSGMIWNRLDRLKRGMRLNITIFTIMFSLKTDICIVKIHTWRLRNFINNKYRSRAGIQCPIGARNLLTGFLQAKQHLMITFCVCPNMRILSFY